MKAGSSQFPLATFLQGFGSPSCSCQGFHSARAWCVCVPVSACECVPVDLSVPVSVGWGEGARGTRASGASPPHVLGVDTLLHGWHGLAWGQVLSSFYEDAAVLC